MRKTKIVCTIGPPSRSPEALARLIDAGMNVARINMSHGSQDEHAEVVRDIRRIAAEKGVEVAILQDLAGSKIRLGELEAPVDLAPGDEVELTTEPVVGRGFTLPIRHEAIVDELAPGERFSMADGLIGLETISVGATVVRARVLSAGTISSRKGVNVPRGGMTLPSLTEKDERDLRFGIGIGVDWAALSFVRSAKNADAARAAMDAAGRRVPLIAKIEKRQAIEDLDAILEAFDGIMVARGDLGIEIELERVPAVQKDAIERANRAAKPAIVATQMLLSMVRNPRPTRAEVADVANAILDGCDAVMLSEETAQGERPIEAVETLARIAREAEKMERPLRRERPELGAVPVPLAVSVAAERVAEAVGATLIATPTSGGSTARMVASRRPRRPVLAITTRPEVARALALVWGVVPKFVEGPIASVDRLHELAREASIGSGLAKPGDRVVVTGGAPLDVPGTTNFLQVWEL